MLSVVQCILYHVHATILDNSRTVSSLLVFAICFSILCFFKFFVSYYFRCTFYIWQIAEYCLYAVCNYLLTEICNPLIFIVITDLFQFISSCYFILSICPGSSLFFLIFFHFLPSFELVSFLFLFHVFFCSSLEVLYSITVLSVVLWKF